MAAAVDLPYLSNYLSIAEPSLQATSEDPTVELVNSLLQAVAAKAREHDEIRADKLRLDVELENAVRTGETRTRGLKSTVDKALKEAADLREKVKREEDARNKLESDLHNFKSSSSTSSTELDTLRSRITSLESSNRDTLSLLESKSTAHDRLATELSDQHQKTIELRREISDYEQKLQSANSAAQTAKFRESHLQQELDLVRKSNEWFEGELKAKAAELSKNRREKGARIAELQRQNEEANATIEAIRRTEAALRTRLDDVGRKADEAFAKVQQLQEDAAKERESYRTELESQQRLTQLLENQTNTARTRLQEVSASQEQSKEEAAAQIQHVNDLLEQERADREAAESRVSQLELDVDKLESDLSNSQNTAVAVPGTPRRRTNGISSPGYDASHSPGISRVKGNLNFTQLYGEYTAVKADLDRERRRNERANAAMDEMIRDLETKQPEIEELRAEHQRLESEVLQISSLLEDTAKERDKARKEARKWEGQVTGKEREGNLLRQQLRDLSAQIKLLLSEIHARDEGLDSLTAVEQAQLERFAHGDVDDDALEGLNDTGRVISQRLLLFKDIRQLQEQNMQLLRATRELGDRLEGEEAIKKQDQQAQDQQELRDLRERVGKYKDEMKSMVTKSQSYIKERDMFRRMLQHRGQLPPNADVSTLFGQSVDSRPPGTPSGEAASGVAQSPNAKDAADLSRVIKEMQQHFDAYREEASTDHRALKEQSEKLSRDRTELQAEIAKSNSQLTLAHERFEMLQANYGMLKSENGELQKRSNTLSEAAAKQDVRTQQVAEELVEAKALVDSMRNESANLKAEKELWKRIEKRLTEDNESLMNERSRLNGLITNLQNLQNERELSDSESRRKMQTQLESLASELQTTKRRLDEEVEDGKKATLRREVEQQRSQKSIDDLRSGLAVVREELVAAKTTRDHLQARVDELTIELKSAEERVQVLQPRPSTRAAAATPVDAAAADDGEGEDALSKEQQLAVEASELRRDLELAKAELESAKGQVEQYKAISQASEEELQVMNDSHDEYKETMDAVVEQRDGRIRELEQRLTDVSSEFSSLDAELSTLRGEKAENARQVEEEKAALEAEISRLKDEDERHSTAAQFHQEDLKAQAEIAQQAQQNYENELLQHAEAARSLQKVRAEYNELRTSVVQFKTEAEAARESLDRNTASWEETRERYERELAEMRTRRDDVDKQNKLLHQQLENVGAQISALQQQRTHSFTDNEEIEGTPTSASADRTVSELREVISFLRRDKEIVDVQFELSIQESKRLKQQLDYAQQQLDNTRLKLDEERRSQAESTRSSMTHSELTQKINELNLYRESAVTLRNEAQQAQTQLAEKSQKVEELFAQIEPLKTTIRELENEKETNEGEMRLLREDRDHWQTRTQNILQKYNRVDPAEMDALKEDLSATKAERDELKSSWQPLKDQVESIPAQIVKAQEEVAQTWRERNERQVAQFKDRSRQLNAAKNEKVAELQTVAAEKQELEQQLQSVKQELEAVKTTAANDAQAAALENGETTAAIPEEERHGLESRATAAEAQAREESSRAQILQGEVESRQARISHLEQQISELQQRALDSNAKLALLQSTQQRAETVRQTESAENLDRLRQDLEAARVQVATLESNAVINASIVNAPTEDGTKSVAQQVLEQVQSIQQELEVQQAARVQQAEAQFKQRADVMKAQLSKKLGESKEKIREELVAEYNKAVEALKIEHQQTVERIEAQHQLDLSQLKANEATRLEQERQIWLAENGQNANLAPDTLSPAREPGPEWVPSELWVKDLVASNPTVKAIVGRNINGKLNQEREALAGKIKGELESSTEQRVKELQQKAESEKEKAVAMEAQRQKVKLSMAEGKVRGLLVKVEVVQKAATDTPQKPVVEVWEVAKVARPTTTVAPTTQQQQTAQQQPTSAAGQSQTQPAQSPSTPTSAAGNQLRPQRLSNQAVGSQGAAPQQSATQVAAPPATTPLSPPVFGAPSQLSANSQLPPKPASTGQNVGTGPGALRALGSLGQGATSGIPRMGGGAGQRGGRGGGRGGGGHQQAALQQQQQGASIAQVVGQGQSNNQKENQRGGGAQQSGLPRGGGRGRGRGGQAAGIQTGGPTVQGQSQQQPSPTSTGAGRGGGGAAANNNNTTANNNNNVNLNAAAKQFVPGGNKRQREDGGVAEVTEGGRGGGGKRARGGGNA
ncbi:MAG: hypothetical protein M1825_006066 [Sarcosagium campestre]|nr:MAG: hypothetical protein M1825_006066 [Sarcosagium campestre]